MTEQFVKRRADLAERAAELFAAKGYHGTAMIDLAQHLGVSKANLYHYFDGKDEILFLIHGALSDMLYDRFQARAKETDDPVALLRGIVEDLLDVMANHTGHFRVFFENYRELSRDQRQVVAARRKTYEEIVVSVLDEGVRRKVFKPMDTMVTALGILGMGIWTYQWYRHDTGPDLPDVTDGFWNMVASGVRLDGSGSA